MSRILICVLIAGALVGAQSDPQALQRMVATERAFAAATAEIGVRDGFLSFFADDAIDLAPGADGTKAALGRAKEGLEKLEAAKLPLMTRLMWEPFTGQVSADGDIGWLTGASVNMSLLTSDVLRTGAYFSVWKRQRNGTWRVWLDEGCMLPTMWNDASPFRVAPDPDAGTAGVPGEPVDAAEQAVASGGEPWRLRLSSSVRVHRDGKLPFVGREQAVGWAVAEWRTVRYATIKSELASSDDLAIVLGGYDATPMTSSAAEHGTWIRAWKRDVTNRWRIVFETSKIAR
jgi:ketosteroid isomerase-like protein